MDDLQWIEDVVPNYVSTLKVGDKLRIKDAFHYNGKPYKRTIEVISDESITFRVSKSVLEETLKVSLEGKILLGNVKKKGIFLYKKIHNQNKDE